MLAHLQTMARYNRWANAKIINAVMAIGEDDYYADRGAFFGSIHGTLNHILLVDRLWRGRVEGVPYAVDGLDQIVAETRDDVVRERAVEDDILIAFVDGFDDAALNEKREYTTTTGLTGADELRLILGHMFNHATHHRGQVHGLLSLVPADPPPLDLIYYLREMEAA